MTYLHTFHSCKREPTYTETPFQVVVRIAPPQAVTFKALPRISESRSTLKLVFFLLLPHETANILHIFLEILHMLMFLRLLNLSVLRSNFVGSIRRYHYRSHLDGQQRGRRVDSHPQTSGPELQGMP